MARNLFVRARVADWEKHFIDSKAKEAGISESEFVRRAAMDKNVTSAFHDGSENCGRISVLLWKTPVPERNSSARWKPWGTG